jgi:hypothetical protein
LKHWWDRAAAGEFSRQKAALERRGTLSLPDLEHRTGKGVWHQ